MADGFNLPRLDDLTNLIVTPDEMQQKEFPAKVKKDKVKMVLVNNQIAYVAISPQLYDSFIKEVEMKARSIGAGSAA